ncbi:RluA family pseudouridine synthase [Nodosilinea sp. LEGE 07088]|uniref:RluA family pseudouridine synthase n=1 Tax=Nodosilinea sp. LEGE 07088 TaxID=2777968 RepID=UPI001881C68C|nr:RluA family pseudouridine synthase [Nodosilinea sp. LEGE 07088]MBE9140800.1 RluA family pseudouridine synthase [Nodosilinea sp. LEGE 07088]
MAATSEPIDFHNEVLEGLEQRLDASVQRLEENRDTDSQRLDERTDNIDYTYQGHCPRTGQHYTLPRTALAKAIARGLMAQLGTLPEGKMFGVLLAMTPDGSMVVLKAFSGLWQGQAVRAGWVLPLPGREQVVWQEARTLDQIRAIDAQLQALQELPDRTIYTQFQAQQTQERQTLNQRHRDRRQARAHQRQALANSLTGDALAQALAQLDQHSRGDKAERRRFKQRWRDRIAPLATTVQAADAAIAALKQQRRDCSRQLQADMHAAYTLTNFAGESAAIQALAGQRNLPTGTGDCCAPKLLHAAAHHGLKPLAMAEFWWGPPQGDKQPGEFYGACAERCQPILGFLLSGLSAQVLGATPGDSVESRVSQPEIPILYQDDWLMAVEKPAGLLSVPGRYCDRQDSLLTRLQLSRPADSFLQPVHRLDQATSGVLVLALDAHSHRQLSDQFQHRRVQKTYQAIVAGPVSQPSGLIDLPLWGNPAERPHQRVHWQRGKPSQTRYKVLAVEKGLTRVALYPLTGRTHQLRVHAAHPQGLNAPIWGDRLYGQGQPGDRLHLHAQTLAFVHPQHQAELQIESAVPF